VQKTKAPLIVSITSGKGGVGKTLTTVNFAVAARRMGLRVLIFDGDLGLANVDVVLGLQARYNINDVLEGQAELSDIILDGPAGIRIIPSGSGIAKLTQLGHAQRLNLLEQINHLDEVFDLMIIDTGAGIAANVLHFNAAADKAIVVTTPEPHAMTDAYAMIKVLNENYGKKSLNLLVNMASSAQEGLKVYERIAEVAKRFLKIEIDYVGHVPMDPQVKKLVAQRCTGSEQSHATISGQAWNSIARSIIGGHAGQSPHRNQQDVWRELLWLNQAATANMVEAY